MKIYIAAIITLFTLSITAQDNCFKRIKQEDWNMIICIDSFMGVNSAETPLKILHRDRSYSLDGEIFVTIEYAKSKSPSKLLKDLHGKELTITDIHLFNEKQKIATSLGFIKNDKGILFRAHGLINYKNATFKFEAQLKDSSLYHSFFIKTLNSLVNQILKKIII